MLIIPIRTESPIRRTPAVNYGLVVVNVALFVAGSIGLGGAGLRTFLEDNFVFRSTDPAIFQFIGYQFLHGDFWHLAGNMLFLWVFGNSVNAKMGNGPYLLFYLAGGILAAWGYAALRAEPFYMIGASGAIASVTTAYLALYPRSRVKVLVWLFVFVQIYELPALILITAKIIIWDDLIVPRLATTNSGVASGAHLAGYLFGFLFAMSMLWLRALPRDQFDMLALWRRWGQRRAMRRAMRDPAAAARATYGTVGRAQPLTGAQRRAVEAAMDRVSEQRVKISDALAEGRLGEAAEQYARLAAEDPTQCLAERQQLQIAREFYASQRFPQAAAAFDRFLACYPQSAEAPSVRLLVGIIYARDLRRYEEADKHLTFSLGELSEPSRRDQCLSWLAEVRAALGRPAP